MFKSILLAVDASEYSETCTRYAIEYGAHLGAHIRVLTVLDRKEFAIVYPYYYPTSDFPPVFNETVFEKNELYEKQRERAQEVLQRIEKECSTAGIPYACEIDEGIVSEVIVEEAHYSDLLFMGQRGVGAAYNTDLVGSNLKNVLRQSRFSVILTPQNFRPLRRILVCYDGSGYALNSLRIAIQLASAWLEPSLVIRLLVVNESEEIARQLSQKVEKYLQAYQKEDILIHRRGDPAEQIVAVAKSEDVDLVAMGAYGHGRIHSLFLGCTTETVMRTIDRALLLHH